MNNHTIRHLFMALVFLFSAVQVGCATARTGEATSPLTDQGSMTARIKGQDKASLIKILGDPDFITEDKQMEYWGYHSRKQQHLNLYYFSGGKADAKDLIVVLSESRARNAYLVDKGSSFGIIASPLSIPE